MAGMLSVKNLNPAMVDDLYNQYQGMLTPVSELQPAEDPSFDAVRQQMYEQNLAMQNNGVPSNAMVAGDMPETMIPQGGMLNAPQPVGPMDFIGALGQGIMAKDGETPFGDFVGQNWQGLLSSGISMMQDAYMRDNLPAETYIKLKAQENDKIIAEQNQFLNNLKLQADLDYQRQSIDLKREELAIERQRALSGGESPSAVREYEFYTGLTPEEQRKYLSVKRAQQVLDLGSQFGVLSPEGAVTPVAEKGLAPGELPSTRYEQSAAAEQAKVDVGVKAALEKKTVDSDSSLVLLQRAKELLPQATAGALQEGVKAGAAVFGKATEGSTADAQLNIISAKLVGTVPRFEGPQSNIDVQMYKEAAGNLANTSLPTADRLAAANFMEELAAKYATKPETAAPSAPTTTRLKFNPATGDFE